MIMGICVPLSTRNLCRRPCMGKQRHRSRFREMLLLMDCYASVTLLGNPTTTFARLLPNIEFFPGTLWVVIKWNFISHSLPKTPLTMSSAQLFILLTPLWRIVILNCGRTVLHISLRSHLDPLRYYMTPPRQIISLWRSIVQQLAASHAHIEQSALRSKMFLDISYLLVWKNPNRPHECWRKRTPCRQLRHSALPHRPCETALLKKFELCCFP
ncbi:hypothetical protein ECC02_009149 [Trypanosoma cruzi]|uniref:Uncharacterized protein n=1 Tax=Trypanosoma cruzi TaxID=5693 RepID=A0A7J6XU15_TRYCR|nr:hypothetical protein ECC02_009149 [Trypanosoma cruzi]